MSSKYITKGYYETLEEEPYVIQSRGTMSILESDKDPIFTGLLDKHGTKLYKVNERIKIGFIKE